MYHIVICDDDTLFIDHMKCLLLRRTSLRSLQILQLSFSK